MTTFSKHAQARAQQRAIPPVILDWLSEYGEESFDGSGALVRFFSHKSQRRMERVFGRRLVQRIKPFLQAYAVESLDGQIITAGWRHKTIRRR